MIVPTYNRASDLNGSVESILAQTVPADEILIVDDGSTDDTVDMVATLPGPVRFYRQENQGPGPARNLGLQKATGDYIAFLDADDRWDPRKTEVQLRVLEERPEVGWCSANLTAVDGAGTPRPGHRGLADLVPVFADVDASLEEWLGTTLEQDWLEARGSRYEYFHGDAFTMLLHGNVVFPSATMIRRETVEEVGPFNPRFHRTEDDDYFLRMARLSPVAVLTEPLVSYRTGEDDALTASHHAEKLIQEAMECLASAADKAAPLDESEKRAYQKGRELLHRRRVYTLLSNLEQAEARNAIREFWGDRGAIDVQTVPHFLATFAPTVGLEWLARAKRGLRAIRTGRFVRGGAE